MKFNIIYYFASALMPFLFVLLTRGLTLSEALLGCFISSIVFVYKLLESKLALDTVKEYKDELKKEHESKLNSIKSTQQLQIDLDKAQLKLEYEGRISKLEEMLTRNNLEKMKRM